MEVMTTDTWASPPAMIFTPWLMKLPDIFLLFAVH